MQLTNNQVVCATQLVCAASVFLAPTLYWSLAFFILCHLAVFNYDDEWGNSNEKLD